MCCIHISFISSRCIFGAVIKLHNLFGLSGNRLECANLDYCSTTTGEEKNQSKARAQQIKKEIENEDFFDFLPNQMYLFTTLGHRYSEKLLFAMNIIQDWSSDVMCPAFIIQSENQV